MYLYGVLFLVIVSLAIWIVVKIKDDTSNKNPRAKDGRIGYVAADIPAKYSNIWNRRVTFKIKPTGLEFENGKIEIKIIEIISFGDNGDDDKNYALSFCRKNFKVIDKSNIKWESLKPLVIVNANDLNKLLKNEEVVIQDSRIQLDKDYAYDEIINIMLK